ncbi:MAG: elongation factor G [Planctomycetes bacterium]|nr:elongation factor G [Planctomycetota bacterium]MCG2682779.1 elongation factor G [Planctomycetales bacterium]
MSASLHNLRNIGVIAHIDAGKTTITERMLFFSGFSHRVGEVDKGTTVTDYDAEEQERGITINAAAVNFPWKDIEINLIDTPGHVDFTAEVERSLRVLDGGVVVFSAREGVEAQSETVWRQADKYHVPRIAFINKMDREGADYFGTLDEIRDRLGCKPIPLNLPVGAGPPHLKEAFCGVIDLISMRMLRFTTDNKGGKIAEDEIPAELRDEAELWRAQMLDQLSIHSDELTELLLAEEPVPEALVRRVMRAATIHNLVVPVLCGSALDGIGVQPVLDAVQYYLPGPADVPAIEGTDPKNRGKKIVRHPNADEPFCGLVFKIQADRHGDLHYVRVYSGTLKANSRVYNPGKEKKENVPQLWRIQADRRTQVESVAAGDIIGIVGLRHSITGDTLCTPQDPILLESITFPETVVSMAIEPETSLERKKLSDVLEMMKRQDPTFRARENEETGQTLISGMGELHLEVIKHRLLRDYRLNVRVHKPRVSYRESIQQAVEVTGECHRNVAGQTLSAKVRIRMEPFAKGVKPVTVLVAPGGVLPEEFLTPAVEVLGEQGEGGGMLGFPLMRVKITVLGGEVHETGSTELAFRYAAGDAFEKALRAAGPVLLEPIMRIEVTVPEDFLGEIMGDLQQRRAIIVRTHVRGRDTVIEAHAPLANLFGYSNAMRGLSQGRATCTMEPHSYGPAPEQVLEGFM